MNGSMGRGGRCPMAFGGDETEGGIPLIPAPVACFTMVLGLMIGIMIGRKKSMMHGGGMGMGMTQGGGDWMMRKKMMGGMGMHHHHHGSGMPECKCGDSGSVAAGDDQPTMGE
jgi:hypothetical protein